MPQKISEALKNTTWLTIIISQVCTKVGDLLASTKTVLPWLFTSLGVPPLFIGLIAPIRESGALLPQMLMGELLAQYAYKKWAYALGALLQGVAILGIATAAVYTSNLTFGVIALCLLVLFSLARALASLASKDVLGKVVEKKQRGNISGTAASIAGVVSIAVGALMMLGIFNDTAYLPALLTLAACAWLIAAVSFLKIKEQADKPDENLQIAQFLSQLIKNAQSALSVREFRQFIIVRTLLISTSLALPYYIVLTQSQEPGLWTLGLFMLCGGAADFLSGWIWGRFSDVSSRKVLMASAALACITLTITALLMSLSLTHNALVAVSLFAAMAVVHAGVRIGRSTYLLDMADDENRLRYVALSNTLIGILLLLLGVITAWIASVSLMLTFCCFAALAGAAVWRGRYLPEVE